ncbi:HAD-IIIC family phosphatase [Streptomyces sp. T-3]|nr:HAD-IIIC family phosphatase [Streptomyces sp. T-3]
MTPSPRPSPVEQLRTLRDQDRLAAEWPEVAPLLAELADAGDREEADLLADWLACGRILSAVDPAAVRRHHPGAPLVTVAITGHATFGQLADPLTAELARHGLLSRLVTGMPGAWLRDLTDPAGELTLARPDMTLCVLDAGAVFDELPVPWNTTGAELACARLADRLRAACAVHAEQGHGTLVLNTLPLLRTHTHQLVDEHQRAQLSAIWREFNARLLRLTDTRPGVAVIDLDPLIAETGPATDARLACYARAPFSEALLASYAREAGHLLRSRRGLTKKCLVLDLDGTLWAGVLGDDGFDGIDAGNNTLRGAPHAALQAAAKQLAAQGVLLAVSSKNDPGPVHEVLRAHPDLQLREEDFVRVNANWHAKDASLRDIAESLDIGVGSLVFADDSAAERALIRSRLPEVAVAALNGEPALHLSRLLREGWFTTPRLTADDPERTARYRAAAARHEFKRCTGSYEEYLRELDLQVSVRPALPREHARLAQLSLRTNQFNLTGERLSEQRVAQLAEAADRLLLAVYVADRFGDSGLAGAVFARRRDDGLYLDNFLLSCRVLARGVEQGVIAGLLDAAAREGLPAVHARFRATARNGRARAFYPGLGFTAVPPPAAQDLPPTGRNPSLAGEQLFTHQLAGTPAVPDHLTLHLALATLRSTGPAPQGG